MSQREVRLADFPDRQLIFGAEGGVVYAATRAGKFYVIVDESMFADFLGEDEIGSAESLIQIHEFSSASERAAFLSRRGWSGP
ncbi:MAG TPA: hypothetical protein VN650_01130 [Gemmatimonadaceae bacterium]|jgi:hypothetical protein|nr:hypothetical protein [Gemmatimonadaceae bacterium]